MGLTKQYLRYQAAGNFNIISSGGCNVVFVTLEGQEGRFVGVAACEDIIVWDLRLGEKAMVIPGDKHLVTRLAASPAKRRLAAGYADGTVKVFDLETGDALTTFAGHRSAVTCLAYDAGGHRLASGAKDTDIILWDVIAETGITRLSGHKGVVTEICFLEDGDYLVSSSKDTFVKFWDLATSHCFKTLVDHQTEVWGLALMQGCHLVTGSGDSELRVWHVEKREPGTAGAVDNGERVDASDVFVTGEEADVASPLRCRKVGAVLRAGRGRVLSLARDGQSRALACHGSDGCVELFSFAAEEEGRLRMRKRQRKERQKREKAGEESTTEGDVADARAELTLKDIVRRLPVVKVAEGKVKAVDLIMGKGDELRVAVSLSNNCVELHSLHAAGSAAGGAGEASLLRRVASQGHRTEVRSVCFSSDGLAVVSAAADTVKMWNRPSLTCLRTVDSGYVLCSCFVPGDRHVLAGLKDGRLLIVDIASGDVLEEIPAHTKELWAVCLMPDSRGCVTGGGDHTVRFWQFELVADEDSSEGGSKAKVLSLLHKRTLKLEETVLAVAVSPNGNLVAVALLDSTVKIFFVDTLKFFVSLYGHKLPVLCLDISYDSTLIVTGSSDRNVKVWGLDFGDCHKSLFAHDDSVTAVRFVPRTHQFFSCGKDGRVKQWDADSFDKILTLQGHFGEAWSLAVSPNGQFVVSCGSDRVVRMYERTDEPLVLADEQEGEREGEEEGLATGEGTVVAGRGELGLPSKKTVGSERAAEQLLECLEICREVAENPDAPIHPVMQAFNVKTIDDFVLDTIRRIRPSDLEESLLLLPFPSACHLLRLLPPLLSPSPANAELVCRAAVFLVTIHHAPLVANAALLPTVREIHRLAAAAVHKLRDLVGYNLHGLQHLQHEMEERDKIQLFRDAAVNKKNKRNRKVRKRTIVTL